MKKVYIIINYSIYPKEFVFEGWDNISFDYKIINYNKDVKLIVEKIDAGSYRVMQVLTTDPRVYLNSNLNPGKLIKTDLHISGK